MLIVSEETVQYRLGVCKSCPHVLLNFVCKKCGCPIKRKVKKATADYCPDGRWEK